MTKQFLFNAEFEILRADIHNSWESRYLDKCNTQKLILDLSHGSGIHHTVLKKLLEVFNNFCRFNNIEFLDTYQKEQLIPLVSDFIAFVEEMGLIFTK